MILASLGRCLRDIILSQIILDPFISQPSNNLEITNKVKRDSAEATRIWCFFSKSSSFVSAKAVRFADRKFVDDIVNGAFNKYLKELIHHKISFILLNLIKSQIARQVNYKK